jgi:hypothetical protein
MLPLVDVGRERQAAGTERRTREIRPTRLEKRKNKTKIRRRKRRRRKRRKRKTHKKTRRIERIRNEGIR